MKFLKLLKYKDYKEYKYNKIKTVFNFFHRYNLVLFQQRKCISPLSVLWSWSTCATNKWSHDYVVVWDVKHRWTSLKIYVSMSSHAIVPTQYLQSIDSTLLLYNQTWMSLNINLSHSNSFKVVNIRWFFFRYAGKLNFCILC